MTVAIQGVDKVNVYVQGVNVKQSLSPANETVNKGLYDPTTLSTVDGDLATANIKSGITIFGKVGSASVLDVSDADAAVTDVKDPRTFYSVTGPRKTGTMPTVAITAANDNYLAGYHAGNAGGLDAIDLDLAPANIKYGVTIFGKAGSTNVRDTTDADAAVANVLSPKTFYAGGGAIKTGTMGDYSTAGITITPSTANQHLPNAGYWLTTDASMKVLGDADLAVGNIKTGVNIFGIVGTYDTTASAPTAAQMILNKVAWANGAQITGTMPTVAIADASNTYSAGYHAGNGGGLSAVDAHLAVGNIKTGVNIFGTVGTYDTTASAPLAAQMILNKVAWANGAQITGTMPTVALDPAANAYPAGYHAGAASLTAVDADLAAGNIKSGVTIFGVAGTFVSTLAEDLISNVWGPLSNDTNYFTQSIAAGGDYTIVTTTPTFAANSMAVAAGFALCAASEANSMKLRLFMGGVQVAESAYLLVWTNRSTIVLRFTTALSGAQTCYLSCHNYYALDKLLRLLYTANVGEQSMSGIIVGSIKLV